MCATGADGRGREALAINEVSLLRETRQAAKIRILVDGKTRLAELICDGILVSTPPAAPPTTCRRTARSCRSARSCCR
jgi:NAD+ kinase